MLHFGLKDERLERTLDVLAKLQIAEEFHNIELKSHSSRVSGGPTPHPVAPKVANCLSSASVDSWERRTLWWWKRMWTESHRRMRTQPPNKPHGQGPRSSVVVDFERSDLDPMAAAVLLGYGSRILQKHKGAGFDQKTASQRRRKRMRTRPSNGIDKVCAAPMARLVLILGHSADRPRAVKA